MSHPTHATPTMTRWKVTLILEINDDTNPMVFIPNCLTDAMKYGEDLINFDCVRVEPDFDLEYEDQGYKI